MAKLKLTELVLRDAHQSLLATRMRLDDMLPIAEKLDNAGYWSIESWGGATFDSCIRYLGEDPWQRIRELKAAMPNTKQQMLLRGQNLLGYRHYADDVVEKFVERAHKNGVDVFRIFDAMNDVRNLETAIKAAVKVGAHAQGTISYTVSPVHTLDMWLKLAKQLEELGCHSICIKDMAGLLKPYDCEQLIKGLKETVSIPIAMQCHATTGLSTATYQKAIDAGIDMLDTAISSMSMTYGHSATETIVSIVEGTERDTGLDLNQLEEIAAYFRDVRKKYAAFEGSLKGVDGRILLAQVPGGMLTNMENQLKEQGAADKLDQVLLEIPRVREDLGFIPLVTPTSQIVGTQAVLNVLTGERYKTITKETAGVLKGEYGATPAPMNKELQERVLEGAEAITCRPADKLEPELEKLEAELLSEAKEQGLELADDVIDDVLTYALFPQIGLKFIKNRNNPDAFEAIPTGEVAKSESKPASSSPVKAEQYSVKVDGKVYDVVVAQGGELKEVTLKDSELIPQSASASAGETLNAPLAGNIFKVKVKPGQTVNEGDVVIIMEAMKMETEVRAVHSGTIAEVLVAEGDSVATGDALIALA
ncbi:sodium-extruding oxaloacetate decarboxylase subunit alpha [Pseudoalteromonas shioyasakiensis]|uniref:sodium-extruding oxaloacetate decarboxylase subunit alpha n=1 Tax=Pseudoalteromonas TaxID=53246 RepID=UPI0010210FFA|nr:MULTISPECIES: sodium-extruding oxaloacetate decarboxylase subunit alpha [Pseudoalteromonas]MCG9707769.1 sodium-extruding oxaloacetate decarboxylase subunit alpha [Pseudoalteromonas sp. Isolate3]MCP4587550.1 sodium-extruding oxaloacetate decarboxylase subunit alpha [Pseudoalteromonas sp.]MCQ8880909.1 sodium-extruding oxaloacetate decarboxylase subunit alpha [Pseudoalteromonas shioyasakiensis]NIZ07408.1 sodium-extruding oxaloacetate decarboxylase subunit alpha [Pseudoalteromonas sp. HF66]QLE1|eukprot:gnl/Carplike_NY0171/2995_a4027_408.p1 GENE.gnl/Carplike_NY0171/2995_a4027_408~~gnl/Carplike_NY0171/2995_a4027_408.p1  ORF type:complete len:591 (-),score=69.54 gnl/Carplike_NY0171/2995_a4027_408:1123-2895(-)